MSMIGVYIRLSDDDVQKALTDAAYAMSILSSRRKGTRPTLDIHKSWNGLNYVLTGEPHGGKPPLSEIIMGGQPTGANPGYGAARVLPSARVAQLSACLEQLGEDGFKRQFQKCDFDQPEIYVYGDSGEDKEEIYEELLGYFQSLSSFYKETAASGEGLMLCIM